MLRWIGPLRVALIGLGLFGCDRVFGLDRPVDAPASGFAHVQGNATGQMIAGTSVTMELAAAPGDLVACAALYYSGGASGTSLVSLRDAGGLDFTITPKSPSEYVATAGQIFLGHLAVPATGATKAITVTFAATFIKAALWCDEFSVPDPLAFDLDEVGTGSGDSPNTPLIDPTGRDELLYAGAAFGGVITGASLPWIGAAAPEFGCDAEYSYPRTDPTPIAFTGTFGPAPWTGIAMAFRGEP